MRRFVVLRESVRFANEAVRCVVEVIAFFVLVVVTGLLGKGSGAS